MRTYGKLALVRSKDESKVATRWAFVDCEPHVLMRIRRCLPRVSSESGNVWIKATPEVTSDVSWIEMRWPMEMSDEDREYMERTAAGHEEKIRSVPEVLAYKAPARPIETAEPLRDYQAVAVELCARMGGLLLGDELGTGKTLVGIGLIALRRPAIVVTLTALPPQWKRQIERFLPGTRVHIARKGEPYDVMGRGGRGSPSKPFRLPENALEAADFPDVIILNYAKLAGWADVLKGHFPVLVLDEAHELRNGASNKYNAAAMLAQAAELRLGLTGTPVFNYGDDMWHIINVLRPDALGTRSEFLSEWCVNEQRVKHPNVFGSYLRDQGLYIRRTRRDVGRELPGLTIVPMTVDADVGALEAVKTVAADLARRIIDRAGTPEELFKAHGELDWRLRQATGIAKAPHVGAFVQLLVEQGEQVLLYGWHHAVYDVWRGMLDKAGIKYAMFTGQESMFAKTDAVDRFIVGDVQVLIMSLRSGAGLDGLQHSKCEVVVHGEFDWSPQVHRQGNGRLDRDGQTKKIVAYYPMCNTGSDPIIVDVLGVKRQQALGIEDPANVDIAPEVDPDRIRTLAQQYLSALETSAESEEA